MKISPIQNSINIKYKKKKKKEDNKSSKLSFGINYKPSSTYNNFHKSNVDYNKLSPLKNLISNVIDYNQTEKAPLALIELRALVSSTDEKWLYLLETNPLNEPKTPISELKKIALDKIFPMLDDIDTKNRIAKKEFLVSLVNSGQYLNNIFLKNFINLPDEYYSAFKEEIAEKSLYLTLETHIAEKYPDIYLYNYKIIESLNNSNYKNFIIKNKTKIQELSSRIINIAKERLTKDKNRAYFLHTNNYDNEGEWATFEDKIIQKELYLSSHTPQKLAESLNINNFYAEILIKSDISLSLSKISTTKDEKLKNYANFIYDLLSKDFPIRKYYGDSYLDKKNAIVRFIDKTDDHKEKLYKIFENDLKLLEEKYQQNKNIFLLDESVLYSEEGFEINSF